MLRGPAGPVATYVDRVGRQVEVEAKKLCHWDPYHDYTTYPEHLRETIHTERITSRSESGVRVGSTQDYALAHHNGMGPHEIRPRAGRRIAFRSRRTGKMVILRAGQSIRVGAIPANPYLVNAAKNVISVIGGAH